MLHGRLYGLVNDSYPGVVKVGQTSRTTSLRVSELSAATGVPTPFKIAFEYPCANVRQAESVVHRILEQQGWRVSPNREFFRCSSDQVVQIIEDYALCSLPDGIFANDMSITELMAAGDELLAENASPDVLCNALTYYRTAVRRGSLLAHERAARAYLFLDKTDRDHERAISQLKAGCEAGNYYCYSITAMLLDDMGETDRTMRAWDLFFSTRAQCLSQQLEVEEESGQAGVVARNNVRFTRTCRQYIGSCLKLGAEPKHQDVLHANAISIVTSQESSLAVCCGNHNERALILKAIEWTYLHLVGLSAQVNGSNLEAAGAAGRSSRSKYDA